MRFATEKRTVTVIPYPRARVYVSDPKTFTLLHKTDSEKELYELHNTRVEYVVRHRRSVIHHHTSSRAYDTPLLTFSFPFFRRSDTPQKTDCQFGLQLLPYVSVTIKKKQKLPLRKYVHIQGDCFSTYIIQTFVLFGKVILPFLFYNL